MPDWYEVLQVSPKAEPEVIAAAYRRLSRKYHPDVDASPAAAERQRLLNEAYEVLSDPDRRSAFDGQRRRPPPSGDTRSGADGRMAAPQKASPRWPFGTIGVVVFVVIAARLFGTVFGQGDDSGSGMPPATQATGFAVVATATVRASPTVVTATVVRAEPTTVPTPPPTRLASTPQVPRFVNTSKGSPNGANAYSDPAAYCVAAGTADPRMPGAAYRFIGAYDAVKLANDSRKVDVVWRCWDGKLLACLPGAAGAPCDLVDTRVNPSPEILTYCAANYTDLPDGQIPYGIMGHMNAFDWRCRDGRPVIVRRLIAAADIDKLGYALGVWYAVE